MTLKLESEARQKAKQRLDVGARLRTAVDKGYQHVPIYEGEWPLKYPEVVVSLRPPVPALLATAPVPEVIDEGDLVRFAVVPVRPSGDGVVAMAVRKP